MEQDIQENRIEEIKSKFGINTTITPKNYNKIMKSDYYDIFDIFYKEENELFFDLLTHLCFDNQLDIFKELIQKYQINDLSYNEYACFREAVNGESEEIALYILDNFHTKVYSRNNQALYSCVVEENKELFIAILEHKKCILANQDLINLAHFCWDEDKEFSSIVLNLKQFKSIMKSPIKNKVNKDIVNVYDNFIKISNF